VAIDDRTVLHLFEPGRDDSDPALLWFVDLRCRGRRLPTEAESARQWLLDQGPIVRAGFAVLADEIRVGLDEDA
jgi:hypothetical protein